MMKTSLFAIVTLAALATFGSTAHAGGSAGSFGLGAEYQLSGIGGLSGVYDGGQWHAGVAVGFIDPAGPSNTEFDLVGSFFFHIHHTATADFSLGGSLGLQTVPGTPDAMGNTTRSNNVFIEPGFQIRVFLTSNVALSFVGGISIGVADADGVAITAQGLDGTAGIHYYFF